MPADSPGWSRRPRTAWRRTRLRWSTMLRRSSPQRRKRRSGSPALTPPRPWPRPSLTCARSSGARLSRFHLRDRHARLPDLVRYLRGIERRLDKLAGEQAKDAEKMAEVQDVTAEYQAALAELPAETRASAARFHPLDDRGTAGELVRAGPGHARASVGKRIRPRSTRCSASAVAVSPAAVARIWPGLTAHPSRTAGCAPG